MTRWQVTPALLRAVVVPAVVLATAVAWGAPHLVVLGAPFVVPAALGLLSFPGTAPRVHSRLDHHRLHEGQGTDSRLVVDGRAGVEQVTRTLVPEAHVAVQPASGALAAPFGPDDEAPALVVSPRRWGRRAVGTERVALTSGWCGFRWGPTSLPPTGLTVLPQTAPYDSRAEAPHPVGLVGAHRSRRVGSGTELEGLRPFVAGDRLRRISWPVSLRTGTLHVVTTRAEQDAAVVIVVDALRDVGRSEGVDGRASSLDLTVRAAAALAEHHVRRGDRVALRVVGPDEPRVPLGAGPRHLQRITATLARIRPGTRTVTDAPLELGITGGSIVHVLSPMLHAPVVNAAAQLSRRGLDVIAVDTLGERPLDEQGGPRTVEGVAWRMRMVERDDLLDRLAGIGCPVVAWRGPGTVDEVMRRLSRRARLPRVRA